MTASKNSPTMSRSAYKALLRDVSRLKQESVAKRTDSAVESYWAVGECINKLKLSSGAGYHNSVLRDLAADTGFAKTTLTLCVQFHRAYSKPPKRKSVRWSHYRELLRLPTKNDRDFYVKKIQDEGWSSRQLRAGLATGAHLGTKSTRSVLKRPSSPDYVYAARVLDVIDGDTLDLLIDLGFGVKRELRARLANIDTPNLTSRKGRDSRDFLLEKLMTAKSIAVQTLTTDIYGRYVVHLFCNDRRVSALRCFDKGTHLNALLVEEKHAKEALW